jgi:hypothetical protein
MKRDNKNDNSRMLDLIACVIQLRNTWSQTSISNMLDLLAYKTK